MKYFSYEVCNVTIIIVSSPYWKEQVIPLKLCLSSQSLAYDGLLSF